MDNTHYGRQIHKLEGKECFYLVVMAITLGLFSSKARKEKGKRETDVENTTGTLEKNKEGKWKETLL